MKIACLGSGDGKPGDPMYDAMVGVGRLLSKPGITVVTGGFGGAGMEAAPRGSQENGGQSIGYTMGGKLGNKFLTDQVDCHELAKLVGREEWLDFSIRLGLLMNVSGFIIAAGGGAGTMVEFFTAVQFNRKVYGKFIPGDKRRIAILYPLETHIPGYDNHMIDYFERLGLLGDPDEHIRDLIQVCDTPAEAVNWVLGN